MEALKEVLYDTNGELFNFDNIEKTRSVADTENLWAVIISGGGNIYSNYVRYWNDCSAIFNVLIKKYGYRKDQIYVIMADGTDPAPDRRLLDGTFDSSPLDLDGDGLPDIEYAATRSNITTVFNNLSNTLSQNDELFIFTTDHGDKIGTNSTLVLWNNEEMTDADFAALVNTVNAKSINIVMEQCYSGGFVNHLKGTNRVIATACAENELSWATSNLLYDEFVYHWISAAYERKIDGTQTVWSDADRDGFITAPECFEYAKQNDTKPETPQYSALNKDLAYRLTLGGKAPDRVYYFRALLGHVSQSIAIVNDIRDLDRIPIVVQSYPESPICNFVSWEYTLPNNTGNTIYTQNEILEIGEMDAYFTYPSGTTFGAFYEYTTCQIDLSSVKLLPRGDVVEFNFKSDKITTSDININASIKGDIWIPTHDERPMLSQYENNSQITLVSGRSSWTVTLWANKNGEIGYVDYNCSFTPFEDSNYHYFGNRLSGRVNFIQSY